MKSPRLLTAALLALVALAPFANAAFENVPTAPVASAGRADAGFPMVDPSIDDPAKPWCYFTHPVTCIGVPWEPDTTQVTPEGNLFTGGNTEFCLFYGDKAKPMAARQRRFLDGWIPVVQDEWTEDGLTYAWEAFAAPIDIQGEDTKNALRFVSLKVTNTGAKSAVAKVAAGVRHHGDPMRERPGAFDPKWTYAIENDRLTREGKVVCAYPKPARFEAVSGVPYATPFTGKSLGVSPRTEVGLARYETELAPGASLDLVFKLPRVAVDTKDAGYLAAM